VGVTVHQVGVASYNDTPVSTLAYHKRDRELAYLGHGHMVVHGASTYVVNYGSLGSCARFACNYSEILEEELTGFKLQKCWSSSFVTVYFFLFLFWWGDSTVTSYWVQCIMLYPVHFRNFISATLNSNAQVW